MTTRKEVIEALESAREKLLAEDAKKEFQGWTRTIQYHFKDTDEFWHFDVIEGIPGNLVNKESEDADVKFNMSEDTLLGLIDGKINGMVAFTTGKVKVKASLKDISKLQKLV
ncbi:MAG TPA: SCP2 sterol-binding domain-containing protein [Candidatus Bathyarchaeia archaeon]|nr:SCP2 sterol-binding domain-containing protein [Candidatus Bathyarchaeia archaeon]